MIKIITDKIASNFLKLLENGILAPTLWRGYDSIMESTYTNCDNGFEFNIITAISERLDPKGWVNILQFSLKIAGDEFVIQCLKEEVFKKKKINKEKVKELSEKLSKLAYDNIFKLTNEETNHEI